MLGLVMVMTSSDWSSYTQVINIIGLLAVYDTFTLSFLDRNQAYTKPMATTELDQTGTD